MLLARMSTRTAYALDRRIRFPSDFYSAVLIPLLLHSGSAVRLLELGINDGDSLLMWRWYLGPDAKIYGADINNRTKVSELNLHLI